MAVGITKTLNAQSNRLARLEVDTQSDPQTTGYPNSRKIVRDSQGNLYVAYRKKGDDKAFHIFVARLPKGAQQWQSPGQVEQMESLDQRVPSLTIDAADRLHIVWYGLSAQSQGKNDRQIFYAQAPAKATGQLAWTRPLLLAGGVAGYSRSKPEPRLWQEHPVIHATPNGHLYVVWEGKDEDHRVKAQIKVARSTNGGGTWEAWQNIPGEPNSYYSRPTLVSTSDGKTLYVVAYATRRDQEDTHLVWTKLTTDDGKPNGPWQAWAYVTEQISADPCSRKQEQRQVSIVIDAADQLHAVWQQKVMAPSTQICYAALAQGRWTKPQLLAEDPTIYQAFPNLTVDKDERLWAAWNEFIQPPVALSEEAVDGVLRVAKRPFGGKWTLVDLARLTHSRHVLYPSLRWHRSIYQYGVDLIWLERNIQDADEDARCFERADKDQKRPRCIIYYANLAGQ